MKTFLMTMIFISSGLASAQSTTQEQEYRALKTLMKTVKEMSQSHLNCESSKNCKTFPLGHKACGGPSDHFIFSDLNPNYEEMMYLAKRTKVREREYNLRYDVRSNCEYEQGPESHCVNNKCISYP